MDFGNQNNKKRKKNDDDDYLGCQQSAEKVVELKTEDIASNNKKTMTIMDDYINGIITTPDTEEEEKDYHKVELKTEDIGHQSPVYSQIFNNYIKEMYKKEEEEENEEKHSSPFFS